MGSEIKEVILEQVNGTIVQTTEQSNGLISNLLKKFTENKMYIYIAIGVVILAVVAFYYLKKCKKDVSNSNKNTLLPIPKQNYEVILRKFSDKNVTFSFSPTPLMLSTDHPISDPLSTMWNFFE